MISFLQINLNCCRAAQDLLQQTARERRADVIIVCEQHRNATTRWYSDAKSKAAINLTASRLCVTKAEVSREGWTWVELGGIRIYSCYFSPNAPLDAFARDLGYLEESIRTSTLPIILAGDFNAKAPEWGSSVTNRRGALLGQMASHLHLHAINSGGECTFVRGSTGSVIDITFGDENTASRIVNWQVLQTYSHSDHRYISFELIDRIARPLQSIAKGWSVRKLDHEALDETIKAKREGVIDAANSGEGADTIVCHLNNLLRDGCDASMPRRGDGTCRRPVY